MNPKTFLLGYPTNPSSQAIHGVRLDSRVLSLQQVSEYLTTAVMGTVVNT